MLVPRFPVQLTSSWPHFARPASSVIWIFTKEQPPLWFTTRDWTTNKHMMYSWVTTECENPLYGTSKVLWQLFLAEWQRGSVGLRRWSRLKCLQPVIHGSRWLGWSLDFSCKPPADQRFHLTYAQWIETKFGKSVKGSQRMYANELGDSQIFFPDHCGWDCVWLVPTFIFPW